MNEKWDETRLQNYITLRVEESACLEYKSAGALAKVPQKKLEITKDISAFANSKGGILIYGIKEHSANALKHLPDEITPIDRQEFNKEWLEMIIAEIKPKVNVVINSVSLSSSPNHVAYVVEIEKGNTAHQAADQKYYKRGNFQVLAMDDYEIRDLMRTSRRPTVESDVRIYLGKPLENRVWWRLTNQSEMMVRDAAVIIYVPLLLEGNLIQFKGINGYYDDDGFSWWKLKASNHSEGPLFPLATMNGSFNFDFKTIARQSGAEIKVCDFVRVATFADDMAPNEREFSLTSVIKYLEK